VIAAIFSITVIILYIAVIYACSITPIDILVIKMKTPRVEAHGVSEKVNN